MADDSSARELHQQRVDRVTGDATVIPIPNGDSTAFLEADLIYHDLAAGPSPDAIGAHLGDAGGQQRSAELWPKQAPTSCQKDLAGYLDHLRNDLHLEIWDFQAHRKANPKFDVRQVADKVHQDHPGRRTSIHHLPVYTMAPWSFGPFGAPTPCSAGVPPAPRSGDDGPPEGATTPTGTAGTTDGSRDGRPVCLAVLDTGLPENYAELHPRLRGAVAPCPDWENPIGADGNLLLDAGHGLFILDIACRIDPFLRPVYMRRPARDDSNLTLGEHLVALDLWEVAQKALSTGSRLVVNMSFAAHTPHDTPGEGLLRELTWLADEGHDVLVVAAAGNSGNDRKTFPAACDVPNVVSVGALDENGQVASFSSRGDWVDCWTSGVNVAGAYLSGVYDHPRGRHAIFPDHEPCARWNGTSFAAPRVAAAIALKAAEMPHDSLLSAWEALRKENGDKHPHWSDSSGHPHSEKGVVIEV